MLRKQADIVDYARKEVSPAEQRLSDARSRLANFRRNNADIDPSRSAEAIGGLIAGLSEQLAQTRTELTSALAFLQVESTQVKALRARIRALETQIIEEQKRLMADPSDTISAKLTEYERLIFEQEFAQSMYMSALTFLESSLVASQKQKTMW